jgi:hypothetical protein
MAPTFEKRSVRKLLPWGRPLRQYCRDKASARCSKLERAISDLWDSVLLGTASIQSSFLLQKGSGTSHSYYRAIDAQGSLLYH